MDEHSSERATRMLRELCAGEERSQEDLFSLLYGRLRAVAASIMQRERSGHTLQPTALVHEAWMDLVDQDLIGEVPVDEARRRFVGLAAHAMRRVLIAHARKVGSEKRGGGARRITLGPEMPLQAFDTTTLLDLETALEALASRSARVARVAELRLFGGLSVREIAPLLEISLTTAKDDCALAQAMLTRHLQQK